MEQINLNIICVLTGNRKKFDKYVKVNKIKNKIIIDINKIILQECFNLDDKLDASHFKIIIKNKLLLAKEKNKTVYYLPNIKSKRFNMDTLMNLKKICTPGILGLLFFWKDFNDNSTIKQSIIENIDQFNIVQMLEDY